MDAERQFHFGRVQTHALKVSLDCQGCVKKVNKLLKRIEGVYEVKIEAEQDVVTVSGNVDCSTLIRRLAKSGKHAEVLPLYSKKQHEDNAYLDCNLMPMYDYPHPAHGNAGKWEFGEYLGSNSKETTPQDKWGFENDLNGSNHMGMCMEPVMSFPCYSDPVHFSGVQHAAGYPSFQYQYSPWYNYAYPVMHNGMQGMHPPMTNMEENVRPYHYWL